MKKRLVTGLLAVGLVTLVAGCGTANNTTGGSSNSANTTTNSTATNTSTNNTASSSNTSTGVSADLKSQFVNVTASAQTAIDDFVTGTSLLGPMSTKKINGTKYSVVATSKKDLQDLQSNYLDFLSQDAMNSLFSHVTNMSGDYVFQSIKDSGDKNDWYHATVTKVAKTSQGYEVTLSVPQTDGSSVQTHTAMLVQNSAGHWVYAGT